MYTMDCPKIIISNQNEESISELIVKDIQKANFREQINKLFDSVLLQTIGPVNYNFGALSYYYFLIPQFKHVF